MPFTEDMEANVLNAVNDYLMDRGLHNDLPPPNLATARKVLLYFHDYEKEWR